MRDLPIDKMKVDTTLAENYFKNNSFKFPSEELQEGLSLDEFINDGHNKIYTIKNIEEFLLLESDKEQHSDQILRVQAQLMGLVDQKLIKLRSLIKENAALFSQIEYLLRKVPIDEVLKYDIQLMVQNISHVTASDEHPEDLTGNNLIWMDSTTPLANLGCVAQILKRFKCASILSNASTAAVCNLFKELCHKAGFENVNVGYIKERPIIPYINMGEVQCITSGCVSVITENADVDSAVDVLLDTTVQYPWKLRHVLVQECVYDAFKMALRWKIRDSLQTPTTAKSCAVAFVYNDKIFLLDYLGSDNGPEITVEAYRTTKELISLLNKTNYFYMSLWTDSHSESNEISHAVNSDIIWVNDFGRFDGPPLSSQALYKMVFLPNTLPGKSDGELGVSKRVKEIQNKWLDLTLSERFEKINAFESYFSEDFAFLEQLKNLKSNVFMSVHKGQICQCYLKPLDNRFIYINERFDLLSILKNLLIGTIILTPSSKLALIFEQDLFFFLREAGVPVFNDSTEFSLSYGIQDSFPSRVKVVYYNYGTIFAN